MADMDKNRLLQAISACVENGQRLYEDAECLVEAERSTTAVALCIVAQEEFAKAFLLHLVCEGIIPWTTKVRESLYNHRYKQLVGLIMEWLRPSEDEFTARLAMGLDDRTLPTHVADAMKLYVEKVVPQGHISCPPAAGDPIARNIVDGDRDKTKQDALYVRLSKDGAVISVPSLVTHKLIEAELETTERLLDLVRPLRDGTLGLAFDYHLLVETMNFLLLDKSNRPYLLLKETKFDGSVNSSSGTSCLHSITVLIENISDEQAVGVNGHTGIFLDEELIEPLFRINQFIVDPHTTMLCTFNMSEKTFDCGTIPAHKFVLFVDFRYHGIRSDRKYHVHMWSYYDPSAGIFRETLTDTQESVIGEPQALVETTIWSRRPTMG